MDAAKPYTSPKQRKSAWTWKSGRMAQFWVNGKMAWEGQACCKWAARHMGWEKWLRDRFGDD